MLRAQKLIQLCNVHSDRNFDYKYYYLSRAGDRPTENQIKEEMKTEIISFLSRQTAARRQWRVNVLTVVCESIVMAKMRKYNRVK